MQNSISMPNVRRGRFLVGGGEMGGSHIHSVWLCLIFSAWSSFRRWCTRRGSSRGLFWGVEPMDEPMDDVGVLYGIGLGFL